MFSEFPPQPLDPDLELTILMPCLNEAETIACCVRKARDCLERLGIAGEVLIADNGSTDNSQLLAMAEGARVIGVQLRGYGAALFYGTHAARGRFIVMGDADDSYDFAHLDNFVEALLAGADLVVGNRFRGGIRPGAMPWKNRWIGNPALSLIGRVLFASPIRDFHCGLRGISKSAFLRMDLQTAGMEFASEMVIKATLLNMNLVEVPTTLDKDGRSRPPHLRPWRDGWRHLRFMLLFSPLWLFIYPGMLMASAGLVVGALILPGPLMIAPGVGLDIQSLLFAFTALHLGIQVFSFGLLARVFSLRSGLMPASGRLDRLLHFFHLEAGLLTGAVVALVGFGAAVVNVFQWSHANFGPLDPREALRAAIPAASLMTLGVQIVATSFVISVLNMRWRR